MNRPLLKTLNNIGYMTGKYIYKPTNISLVTTFQCNFHCLTCSIWKIPFNNELSEKDWIKILSNLYPIIKNNFVEINGGEALLHKEKILSIIKKLKAYNADVSLNSNGFLITKSTVKDLELSGLDNIKLSVYSQNPKIHDAIRGMPSAHKNAMEAMNLIYQSRINLQIGILITSKNISDIPSFILELKKKYKVNIYLQAMDESIQSTSSKDLKSNKLIRSLWPTKESVNRLFSWVSNHMNLIHDTPIHLKAVQNYYLNPKSSLQYRCIAGQQNLVINPYGYASFCFKGQVIGNALKNTSSQLLRGITAYKERRRIQICQKYCRVVGCNFDKNL